MLDGTRFAVSLQDVCLGLVSFIVPLAAVACDIGRSEALTLKQEQTSFRMGLIASIWSKAIGSEVRIIISDPPRDGVDPGNVGVVGDRRVDIWDFPLLNWGSSGRGKKAACGRFAEQENDGLTDDIRQAAFGLKGVINESGERLEKRISRLQKDMAEYGRARVSDLGNPEAKVSIAYESQRRQRHMITSATMGAKASSKRCIVRSVDAVDRAAEYLEKAKQALARETEEEEKETKDEIDRIINRVKHRSAQYHQPPFIQYVNEEEAT